MNLLYHVDMANQDGPPDHTRAHWGPLPPEAIRPADPIHLAKLKEGAEVWNEWRARNSSILRPSLGEADLRGMNIRHADLRGVDFHGADLSDLDLHGVNLMWASLGDADLRDSDLREANLAVSYLSSTDFRGANLRDARMDGAFFRSTCFGNTNMTGVRGLELSSHGGRSFLDYHTLVRSGPLALPFLRGCGLPDEFINYLPSLLNTPTKFSSCFISYSSEDEGFADRLHKDLQNEGIRCWFARDDLRPGDLFRRRIDDEIRLRDRLLVILSEQSLRSAWVREEVEACLERERREGGIVLLPVRIDDAVKRTEEAWASSIRRQRHISDFRGWKDPDTYRKAFDRLVEDLRTEPGKQFNR